MIEEYTNRELGILIKEGFKGIHDRQDKTNGHVADNATCIGDLKIWKARLVGGFIVTNILLIPVLITFIIGYINI